MIIILLPTIPTIPRGEVSEISGSEIDFFLLAPLYFLRMW